MCGARRHSCIFRLAVFNVSNVDVPSAWVLKAKSTGNRYLAKFVTTLKNWWEEILNFFIERVTNGFVEGLNGVLRTIMRVAFGYRNFVNFRLRIFAQFGALHGNPR
jgi:transposase